jgi:uncharacterized protein
MVQITGYPGIYIEEFTPPSPIQGVGTSTVLFVGTAEKGPVGRAQRIFSWDAFTATFGGFLAEQPPSYLAPAVFGFFQNGGTDCYIVRAGTASHASTEFFGHDPTGPGAAEAVLVVEAIEEGPAGRAINVAVADSSLLASELPGGATALAVHRAKSNLTAALPTGAGADRHTISVASNASFRVGERVVLQTNAAMSQEQLVADKVGTTKVILAADAPGSVTYGGGWLRSADVVPGQREIPVDIPAGFRLELAVPHGTTASIGVGGTRDVRTVDSAGDASAGPTITLVQGMATRFDLNAANLPDVASLEFDLTVTYGGTTEPFRHLSMHAEHPNYWGARVGSPFVTLRLPDQPPQNPDVDPRPRPEAKFLLTGGAADSRAGAWSALLTDPSPQLNASAPFGEIDLVCIPGATSSAAQAAILTHCIQTRRFGILDAQFGATTNGTLETQAGGLRGTPQAPGFVALYYPWLRALNPKTNQNEYWPPSGHVAGIYARSDQQGVHVAPANQPVIGAIGLERRLTDAEQAPLNVNQGVNVLRIFPGQAQPVVWGARTTHLQNRYWQYVNIRRLFLFLEKSIEEGIRWAVFQPNNLELWERLKRSIGDFLTKVWQDGALFGERAQDAFYVRIDEALNPDSSRALGRLYIEIGVRPSYPAEFIVVRIGIWEGGSSVSESG